MRASQLQIVYGESGLDAGTLADEFIDADYKLDEAVRSYPSFFLLKSSFYGCSLILLVSRTFLAFEPVIHWK